MILDSSNIKIINTKDINIHDDILLNLTFERNNKVLDLCFQKNDSSYKKYNIIFSKVIGFEMTACDFWGASECVFDFEYIEPFERTIIPKLNKKSNELPNILEHISYTDFLEVVFTFSSGDKLQIACEKIEIVNFQ